MLESSPPDLYNSLLPPKPEPVAPSPKPKTKGRGRKKHEPQEEEEDHPEPTDYERAQEDLSNLGPLLLRSKTVHDSYVMTLKNDVRVDFHRAAWFSSGEDSFITLYRKKLAHEGHLQWVVVDVCVDDISTVEIVLNQSIVLNENSS
jgi:hypothetical protein